MKINIFFIKCGAKLVLMFGAVLMLGIGQASAAQGWCRAVQGTYIYNVNYTKTFLEPSDNQAGKVSKRDKPWNLGQRYSVICDCTGMNNIINYAPVWYKAVVNGLSPDVYRDGLQYYRLNENLEVASEVWIGGGAQKYLPVPFDNVNNLNKKAICESGRIDNDFYAGSRGYLSLYIRHPFVGHVDIPDTKLFDLYGTRVSGSYGSEPMSSVFIHGSVTVPQSCTVNAGQVINIDFGDIDSSLLRRKGQAGATEKRVEAKIRCNNISNGVKIQLSFKGTNDRNDYSALETSNRDIGIRVKDFNHLTVTPNRDRLPVIFDYPNQTGISTFFLAPINTSGRKPNAGRFDATATLDAEIQ
ncbi:fimbrial protein [Serratia sp. UGAL515B_01]|uniref:fimbrial protein n=1 Tax=Serratia sp. UGAL515B_01 TaxID=2986763 RepID=UPI002955CDAB|nr:fimbrial protein [Serratia sp. UGAL515B_01]WON76480.1 fimbrial protein [Serratia sp. UGAL515B_01]